MPSDPARSVSTRMDGGVGLLWRLYREDIVGGLAAIGIAVVLAVAIGGVFFSTEKSDLVVGRVVQLGFSEGELGSRPVALVEVQGGRHRVILPRGTQCRVNDKIQLTIRAYWWGRSVRAAVVPPVCSR